MARQRLPAPWSNPRGTLLAATGMPLGCNLGCKELWLSLLKAGKNDCFAGRIQPVDATHSLNISAGVWKPSVLRGLSFNCLAIALSWVWEKSERSMPFGMY